MPSSGLQKSSLVLRTLTLVGNAITVVTLFVLAERDVSTVGTISWVAVGSTVLVPLVGAFVITAFGQERPTYLPSAIVPALTTYFCIIAVSIAFGFRGINWLWFAVFWSLLGSSIGYWVGKAIRSVVVAKREHREK
jgi:CDP-diglyceride synthetase